MDKVCVKRGKKHHQIQCVWNCNATVLSILAATIAQRQVRFLHFLTNQVIKLVLAIDRSTIYCLHGSKSSKLD